MSQTTVYPARTQSKFLDWYEQTNYEHVEWDGWNLPMSGESKDDCGQWAWRGCLDYKKHSDGMIWLYLAELDIPEDQALQAHPLD